MKQPIPIFTGNIVNGKLKIQASVRELLSMWIKSFLTGTKVDITIKKHTNKRTLPQNNYYFGVVLVILGDYFGYETEEMHEELKLKFNPVKSKLSDGIIGGSTTKMTAEEFYGNETSYVNRIRRWAAVDFQINIPDPERVE